jgi:hypothetical protein
MSLIVSSGWEQRVRDELGTDEIYVPDSFLRNQIGLAEANIIKFVPEWESMPDDKKIYIETAVICECAALVCPSMPARLPKKESGPHAAYELDVDWSELREILLDKRNSCLSETTGELEEVPFFGLAGPGR